MPSALVIWKLLLTSKFIQFCVEMNCVDAVALFTKPTILWFPLPSVCLLHESWPTALIWRSDKDCCSPLANKGSCAPQCLSFHCQCLCWCKSSSHSSPRGCEAGHHLVRLDTIWHPTWGSKKTLHWSISCMKILCTSTLRIRCVIASFFFVDPGQDLKVRLAFFHLRQHWSRYWVHWLR